MGCFYGVQEMNGRIAKQIRLQVYGDFSLHLPRDRNPGAKLRGDYRDAKKVHKALKSSKNGEIGRKLLKTRLKSFITAKKAFLRRKKWPKSKKTRILTQMGYFRPPKPLSGLTQSQGYL